MAKKKVADSPAPTALPAENLIGQGSGVGGSFELYDSKQPVPTLYFDGIAGALLGPAVTKLQLFTAVGVRASDKGPVEQRMLSGWVTIPTSNLLSFCQSTIEGITVNKDALKASLVAQADALENLAKASHKKNGK